MTQREHLFRHILRSYFFNYWKGNASSYCNEIVVILFNQYSKRSAATLEKNWKIQNQQIGKRMSFLGPKKSFNKKLDTKGKTAIAFFTNGLKLDILEYSENFVVLFFPLLLVFGIFSIDLL